jgi:hypothetical protein
MPSQQSDTLMQSMVTATSEHVRLKILGRKSIPVLPWSEIVHVAHMFSEDKERLEAVERMLRPDRTPVIDPTEIVDLVCAMATEAGRSSVVRMCLPKIRSPIPADAIVALMQTLFTDVSRYAVFQNAMSRMPMYDTEHCTAIVSVFEDPDIRRDVMLALTGRHEHESVQSQNAAPTQLDGNRTPQPEIETEAPASTPEDKLCTLCCARMRVMAPVPCGHRYYCATCMRDLMTRKHVERQCPHCRRSFNYTIRVYE